MSRRFLITIQVQIGVEKRLSVVRPLPPSSDRQYHEQYHDLSLCTRWRVISVSTDAIKELASSFSRIHQLSRLEAINIKFNPVYDNQMSFYSEDHLSLLQASILGALADSFSARVPSKLTALSLLNLRALGPHPLETLPLQAILPTLQCLQLSAVFDNTQEPYTFRNRWRYFWSNLGPRMIPIQTQVFLTELTLHCDAFVGALDGLSLHELYFPHLGVLSLRNIVFNPIRGDEVFVLRHATTLARLEFITCKVLVGQNRVPSPAQSKYTNLAGEVELSLRAHWDRIWDRFTEKLTALVMLDVRHTNLESQYVHRRIGGSYSMIHAVKSRNAADLAALERFRMTVAARSTETHVEP